MDRLWTPWRYDYITGRDSSTHPGVPPELGQWPGDDLHCVFCNLLASVAWAKSHPDQVALSSDEIDRTAGILFSGTDCFLCLNRYPYSTGHVLLLPYQHTSSLAALSPPAALEFITLAQRVEGWLRSVYTPDGLNFGINMGAAAGAGVAGHLHLHALPRWVGDASFMTVVGETRILPELLNDTWEKLRRVVTSGQLP